MNSEHNINPLLDPTKNFWDRHPRLKWFGVKFLPGQILLLAAFATILAYLNVKIAISIIPVLTIIGIEIATFLALVNIIYILDQRKIIKALQNEIIRREKEIAIKDEEVDFLKEKLHPEKREYCNQIFHQARLIDSENPRHFRFLINTMWGFRY